MALKCVRLRIRRAQGRERAWTQRLLRASIKSQAGDHRWLDCLIAAEKAGGVTEFRMIREWMNRKWGGA